MIDSVKCPHCGSANDIEASHLGENRELIECSLCRRNYVGIVRLSATYESKPLVASEGN